MYLLIILLVFGLVVYVLKKRVNYTEENVLEELQSNADLMPKRALVKSEILFRLLDRDMTMGRINSLVFYYKTEKHTMGVQLYNDKLVLRYDDTLYMSANEMKNIATIQGKRLADLNDPVTITEIVYPDTKVQAILENDPLLKENIITGSDKFYDLNVVYEEIKD